MEGCPVEDLDSPAVNLVRTDFAKILVITHIDELVEAVPTRIEVEKGERGSVVRVV